MINTIIFDLDGTLVDSLIDLANTTNEILKIHNYPQHDIDAYRMFVGDGVDKLIERALPSEYEGTIKEYRQEFDKLYESMCLENTKPYPGMDSLVTKLFDEGYHLAIVTNKPKNFASKIAKHLFDDKFSYVFGNTPYQPKKPSPVLCNLAIDLCGVSKHEVIYIGDSDVDIQTAINTKIKSIGCSWGFRGADELLNAGASFVADNPSDIIRIIKDIK